MIREDEKPARQWALRALGRRMHTAHEIRTGLARRGFSDEAIGSVVGKLEEAGYVNDLDFARTWVKSRSEHQLHGRLRLLRDLRQKGVPEEIADSVVKESLLHEDEVDIAKKAAEKKRRTLRAAGAKGKDTVYRYLRSRGFASDAISAAMAGMSFEEDPS